MDRQTRFARSVTEAVAWIAVLLFVAPVLLVVLNSFKDFRQILIEPVAWPRPFTLGNYTDAWRESSFLGAFVNSVVVSASATAGVILLTAPAAFRLSRTKTWYSATIYRVFLIAMTVPFQTIMIPMARLASNLGFYDRLWALVLIYMGYTCGFGMLMYHSFSSTIPRELEESAIIDGANHIQTFSRVIFPLFKPVTGTLVVLYVIRYWNDLLLPLILITDRSKHTIPLSQLAFFSEFTLNRWNLLLAIGVMAALPALLLYVFAQKYIIRGLTSGAVKG